MIAGDRVARIDVTQILPRLGESEAEFKKRRNVVQNADSVPEGGPPNGPGRRRR
jgi:hypothetical protein